MSDISVPPSVDCAFYKRAAETEGFFTLEEASLLIDTIVETPADANLLEIGSYFGRSTLFFVSAMKNGQHLFAVDAFINAGTYSGQNFRNLQSTLSQTPTTLLPMTLPAAFPHLKQYPFDVVLVDGDHSLLGVSQDICLSIELLKEGGTLLCHDVAVWFPAVPAFLNMLVDKGILGFVEKRRTLGKYVVLSRPTWITRAIPATTSQDQLPQPIAK
jgi:predicted O-methyltransferase YrrM